MSTASFNQLGLFDAVQDAYLDNEGELSQKELYSNVARKLGVNPSEHVGKVGAQENVNLFYRACRWVQQSMRQENLLENVSRGIWRLAGKAREKLHIIEDSKSVLAMSSNLGIIICSKSENVFDKDIIDDDIHLVVTSPPYILRTARNYGGAEAKEWVGFIMRVLNRIIPRLADGASIALNIGQDSFIPNMPARHTHIERLTIELEDAGLYLIDRMTWNSNKMPGPAKWASQENVVLNTGYEFVLWFSNNPLKLRSDNQRVLVPHSDTHKKFVLGGGTKKASVSSDGAHRKRVGAYSNTDLTKGKIPTNNFYFANKCKYNEMVNKYAREVLKCPTHGAKFPWRLADFLVRFLSREGDLIVDPFAGTSTVGQAAQMNNRRFVCIEPILEYVKQSFVRFKTLTDDIWINPAFT